MRKPALFCEVHTDDEYRRFIRRRIALMWMFVAAGVVAVAVAAAVVVFRKDSADYDYMTGYYTGVGFGLIGAAAVFLIRFYRMLKNDAKLRRSRIESFDERSVEASRRALCIASYAVMCVVYVTCLIVGLFWYPATQILLAYVSLLLIIYFVVYKILMKRM